MLAGSLALAIALSLASAGVAEARPSNCSTQNDGSLATAFCKSGSGQYRVTTKCRKKWRPDFRVEGPWVRPPTGSGITCDDGSEAYDTRVDFR
jgi:hypothetical protein